MVVFINNFYVQVQVQVQTLTCILYVPNVFNTICKYNL